VLSFFTFLSCVFFDGDGPFVAAALRFFITVGLDGIVVGCDTERTASGYEP
jgi:hypothetical protein